MGLQPLEFSDCLTDSPHFREKLHTHEKELERTSKGIKVLINECKDLVNATKALSKAQRTFSKTLIDFKFECIGSEQTEDEACISNALGEFGKLIGLIEDERDRMMDKAYEQIINPLESFRKNTIGNAKDGKKKFDKHTAKFCQSLEKYLAMKTKTPDSMLSDADVQVDMERRHFHQASMDYVLLLQETQETKKFEFVEILLRFVYQWLTFYHLGHDVSQDFKPFMSDLQQRLQKCRSNYDITKREAEMLKQKMLEVRGPKPQDAQSKQPCTREGYLYTLEKKALGTTWSKYYCQYMKENKILTMIPYNQVASKGMSGITTDTVILQTCTRRSSESIDKRFCFEITVQDRNSSITLQALSEEDRKHWLDAMDGKEPIYSSPSQSQDLGSLLDDVGFTFINKCISAIEANGLDEQGLYRVVGVSSKVTKLLNIGLERKKCEKISLEDNDEWEVKTITSALKNYFRNLPEPLMTFNMHSELVAAAKRENRSQRVSDITDLVHKLPTQNYEMLKLLVSHLRRIADQSDKNLMTIPNLGVCFGPTLMRPREETMAAIMDIKWCNIIVEVLIENFHKLFEATSSQNGDVRRVDNHRQVSVDQMSTSSPSVFGGGGGVGRGGGGGATDYETENAITKSVQSPVYANLQQSVDEQTYAQYRAKLRPTGGIYSQFSPVDHNSSRSSSTESLNSRSSSTHQSNSSINHHSYHHPPKSPSPATKGQPTAAMCSGRYGGSHASSSSPTLPPTATGAAATTSSSTSSISSVSSDQHHGRGQGRKVRTLFQCEAENGTELSFEPNQIIHNVRPSREPGWLEGYMDGKMGLIPANYVEFLN